jgi:hypothetical protein
VISQQSETSQAAYPSLYGGSLRTNEFRLICLSATESPDDPVHLSLEVYDLEECPEYETVSYTWAGEDGDGSLCRPVYIGPYYDVLIQTKNCWEMLRFMRPWRGTRMVWVDAICINQSDVLERNTQVGLMSKIYSAGSRVVVYLGSDVATSLHGKHPRRRRLHCLESGTVTSYFSGSDSPRHSLQELLKLRYFSRIWVIQELLLSQRVVMRVGDVDYWADPVMANYFTSSVPNWDWSKSQAPWVQHVSKGASGVQNLRDLLRISSFSRATDPRDRVFGLLGIMPQHESSQTPPLSESRSSVTSQISKGGLYADYSLSCQHVFIGLFAYCLFVMWHPMILYHASCGRRPPNYPSWAPDWRSQTTWYLLFRTPKMSSQEVFHKVHKMITDSSAGVDIGTFGLYELRGPAKVVVDEARPWHRGAHVCASTGALRINVTHYMALSKPLKRIGGMHGFNVFQMRAKTCAAYILSEHSLSRLSGQEQIFVLNISNAVSDASKMYLILDPIGGGYYRLVSACPFVVIQVPTLARENEVPSMRSINLEDLQYSLHDNLSHVQELMDAPIAYDLKGFFPGKEKNRDILPLLSLLFEQMRSGETEVTNEFISAYLESLDSELHPRVSDDYVFLTVSNRQTSTWNLYIQGASWLDRHLLEHDRWMYRIHGDMSSFDTWANTVLSESAYKKLTFGPELSIEIRFRLPDVFKALGDYKHTILWGLLNQLAGVVSRGVEDMTSLLSREPTDDDHFIGCPTWKLLDHVSLAEILGEFGCTGSTTMVSIE